MQYQKEQHEFKRRQELDYINQVKELDNLEKARRFEGKKALNEDFMFFNENLKGEKKDRKKHERHSFVTDKLDFFPFTSGDLIEKHRESLGA